MKCNLDFLLGMSCQYQAQLIFHFWMNLKLHDPAIDEISCFQILLSIITELNFFVCCTSNLEERCIGSSFACRHAKCLLGSKDLLGERTLSRAAYGHSLLQR